MLNTQKRYGCTQKKMVSLTDDGRQQIQAFADAHQLTFSAAIESLALIGMQADLTVLLVPLLREVVDKALQRNFNRMAKLGLLGAAEAAMAHDLVTVLLLQLIRQEAAQHPADFEERLLVSYDPADELDGRIRATYNDIRRLAQERQQKLLKAPLRELVLNLSGAINMAEDEDNDA